MFDPRLAPTFARTSGRDSHSPHSTSYVPHEVPRSCRRKQSSRSHLSVNISTIRACPFIPDLTAFTARHARPRLAFPLEISFVSLSDNPSVLGTVAFLPPSRCRMRVTNWSFMRTSLRDRPEQGHLSTGTAVSAPHRPGTISTDIRSRSSKRICFKRPGP